MKKVAAIHDLSGFGKSSLTVVIPILSCMGIQVCPVPTAVLSTQTDGFEGYSFLDLTENMRSYLGHWDRLGLCFDSIYTGYLGSHEQIEIIKPFITQQREAGSVILIDPVLGDNGSLYNGMTEEMVRVMREFISEAGIITPNLTEAGFLLDEAPVFDDLGDTERYIRKFKLITEASVIITSAGIGGKYYNICYDRNIDEVYRIEFEMQKIGYPGSGDTFSSILLGKLLQTGDLTLATFFATNKTNRMLKETVGRGTEPREGIPVEEYLHDLMKDDIL